MANPALLFLDSDALIQHLIAGTVHVLRELKVRYGIQAVIVPEVEIEVSSGRFGPRFKPALGKAISNGVIKVFEASKYNGLLQASAQLQASAIGVSHADIQHLGAAYYRRADLGEAYTFAAAVKLGQPAVSNDITAVRALEGAGLQLPCTVLRAFDLAVFAYQSQIVLEADADAFRKALLAERSEFIPKCFRSNSFADGLRKYVPRMLDSSKSGCGMAPSATSPAWANPLMIAPL